MIAKQVNFRLISVVAGNTDALLGVEDYDARHVALLNSLLETVKPQYIVGTCSWKAELEKEPALEHKTILMAQVGPPGFYNDEENDYVFGFHINSDKYPQPALDTLNMYANQQAFRREKQPIKVLYRTKSEFFNSTCRAAIEEAKDLGFSNITEIAFDPEAIDQGNDTVNALNARFLNRIADEACPRGSADADVHPAIFVCTLVEQDQLLKRWRRNGCRPVILWLTASVWEWATSNPMDVPYLQGGAQWHEAFDYSDKYFHSGSELLALNEEQFGYRGTYDVVACYSIAVLFSHHIQSRYRIIDHPKIEEDFASDVAYETLRRDLLGLTTNTLFGPFSLDDNQRNVGRGAAGSQWLLDARINASDAVFRNECISPLSQAEAAAVVPAEVAVDCDAGYFLSRRRMRQEDAILVGKCEPCPVDTFAPKRNDEEQCLKCPKGSGTDGLDGASDCIVHDPHLMAQPVAVMGYTFVGITWYLSMNLMMYHVKNRKSPVVKDFPLSMLLTMCFGAIVSSSSLIALILAQADEGEDATVATNSCRAIPFLYTIGWLLQYGCLFAKAYKMYHDSISDEFLRLPVWKMYRLLAVALLCDMIIVVTWTLATPFEYARSAVGARVEGDENLIIIETRGECTLSGNTSAWAYVVPLLLLHIGIMAATNLMLRKVPGEQDKYKEQKYVAILSVCIGEILVIGIPMLLAVGNDNSSRFIVLALIVFLTDMSILLITFVPTAHRIYVATDDHGELLSVAPSGGSSHEGSVTKEETEYQKDGTTDTLTTSHNEATANPNSPHEVSVVPEENQESRAASVDEEFDTSDLYGTAQTDDDSTPQSHESPPRM